MAYKSQLLHFGRGAAPDTIIQLAIMQTATVTRFTWRGMLNQKWGRGSCDSDLTLVPLVLVYVDSYETLLQKLFYVPESVASYVSGKSLALILAPTADQFGVTPCFLKDCMVFFSLLCVAHGTYFYSQCGQNRYALICFYFAVLWLSNLHYSNGFVSYFDLNY